MIAVSLSAASQPPYMIDKVISQNKIVDFTNQKLLLIDFWATWCTPCGPATEQLEILQKAAPEDVFIVSVSDETEEAISTYLKRNPIRLAVVQDYQPNSMIDLFKVKSRPYAVLLSLDGEILYEGHPANITTQMIQKFAAKMKSQPKKEWNDLFYPMPKTISQNVPPDKEFHISQQSCAEKEMNTDNGVFHYYGPLSELIKYLLNCSSYQIVLQNINDYGVAMSCDESKLTNSRAQILQLVEKQLSINIQNVNKPVEATILDVVNPGLLWDDKQISWSDDNTNSSYLVGTDRIEADNMTLQEIANLLSDVKGNLFYYKGNDTRLHDWNFHYHYDDLMIEDLENSFGIQLKKENISLPVYIVSQK